MKKLNYTKELLEPIVKESKTYSDVLIKLGLHPNNSRSRLRLKLKINEYAINILHFNGNKIKIKYTKELLETLVKQSKSVAEILRKLGLVPRGGNHSYITKRINNYNIDISHF